MELDNIIDNAINELDFYLSRADDINRYDDFINAIREWIKDYE